MRGSFLLLGMVLIGGVLSGGELRADDDRPANVNGSSANPPSAYRKDWVGGAVINAPPPDLMFPCVHAKGDPRPWQKRCPGVQIYHGPSLDLLSGFGSKQSAPDPTR